MPLLYTNFIMSIICQNAPANKGRLSQDTNSDRIFKQIDKNDVILNDIKMAHAIF